MEVHWGACRAALLFVLSVSLLLRDIETAAPYVKPVAVFNIKTHKARSGTASRSAPEGTYRRVGYSPYSAKSNVHAGTASQTGDVIGQVDAYPEERRIVNSNAPSSAYTRNTYPSRQTGASRRPGYPPVVPDNSRYPPSPPASTVQRGYPKTKPSYQRPVGYASSRYKATQPRGYPQRSSGTVTRSRPQSYRNTQVQGYPERRYSQTANADRQVSYKTKTLPTRYPQTVDRQAPYKPRSLPARYPQSISKSRGYPRSPTPTRGYTQDRQPPNYGVQEPAYRRPVPTRTYPERYRSNTASATPTRTYPERYRSNTATATPRRTPSRGYPRTQTVGRTYPQTQSRGRSYPQTQTRRYPATPRRTETRGQRVSSSRTYPYTPRRSTAYKPPVPRPSPSRGYPRTQPSTRYRTPGRHYVARQSQGSYPRGNAVDSLAARPQSSSYSRSYPQRQNSARYDLNTKNYNQKEFWQYSPKQRPNPAPKTNRDYYRPPVPQQPPRSYQPRRYQQPVQRYPQGQRYQPRDPYPRGYPRSYYGPEQRFPQRPAPAAAPRPPTTPIPTTTPVTTTTTAATTTVPAEYEAPEVEMMTGATGPSTTTTAAPAPVVVAVAPTGTPPPGVPAYIHHPKSGYAQGFDQYGNYQNAPQTRYDPNVYAQYGSYDRYSGYNAKPQYERFGGYQSGNYHGWDTGANAPFQAQYPPRAPPTPAPVPTTTTLLPVLPIDNEAAEGEPVILALPPVTTTTIPPTPAVPVPPPFRPIEFKPYQYLNKYGIWQTWYPHYRAVNKYRVRRNALRTNIHAR